SKAGSTPARRTTSARRRGPPAAPRFPLRRPWGSIRAVVGVARTSRGSLLGASVLAVLSACATAPSASEDLPSGTLNRAALRASQPRSIVLAKAHSATFDGSSTAGLAAGMAAGGVVGAAIGSELSDQSAMLGEYQLKDP